MLHPDKLLASSPAVETHATTDATNRSSASLLSLLPLTLLWLSLFWSLSTDWSMNSQYSYGWLVPFLGAAVFWQRWITRPRATPSSSTTQIFLAATAVLLLALPVWLILEANPEWRLMLWTHAMAVVTLSLLFLCYTGGRSWMRHFAFAIIFPLISVPLPMVVEQHVIQNLTALVASITAELAHLNGIPAFRHGNVIEISAGVLGVEEACSGIRSLQSSVLVALFLGEHYRLGLARRFGLLAGGITLAIISNIGRTYALVSVAARSGLEASQQMHDTAATIALISGLGCLFLLARCIRPKPVDHPRNVGTPGAAEPSAPRPVPRWFAVAALFWIAAIGVGVECWYRTHERDAVSNVRWTVREPSAAEGFQSVEIHERSRAMLRYSSGHCMSWRDASAHQWRLYYLRWEPGRNSAQLAKAHTPEICLSAAGGKLKEALGQQRLALGDLDLPFHQYVFDFRGQPLHVFYCLWEDQTGEALPGSLENGSYHSRLAAVRAGRRNLGQTVLEVAVSGPATPEAARDAFVLQLPRLIPR